MKIAKYIGIAFAAILLALAAVAAYVAFTFDAERIKQEAARVVLEKTGRTLTIDGDLALSFWPSIGVKAGKVALSEPAGGERFAAFESVHVTVRLLPLLSKQILADRIELDGLSLLLIRDKEGRLNIDDLLGGKKTESAAAAPAAVPEFDISGIRVTDAQIEWRDLKGASTSKVIDLDFSTGRAHGDANGLGIEAISLSTRGKLDAEDFDLALDVPDLMRKGEQILVEKVSLKAGLKGQKRRVAATLEVSNIEGTMQALKVGGFTADIDAQLGDKSIKGSITSPLELDLGRSVLRLTALDGNLALDMPDMPKRPLKLPLKGQIKAEYAKPAVAAHLATQFDESHIDARFNFVGEQGKPPFVGLDVEIDRLDVNKYLPPSKDEEKKEEPFDFSALRTLNAKGSLHVGELQVKNIKARNVRIAFRATGGRLDVAPLGADLYGGRVSGAASVDANGNRITLKQSLVGVNVEPLIKDVADKDVVEGRGDVTLDIAARGDTATAMKKSLSGTASAVLRDGAIKGINIAQSLRSAKAKLGGGDVSQPANAADKTDFSELSASFKILDGVARNDDLTAKSPFLRLGGSGNIDIGNSRLDYLLKAAVVASAAGQGGKELDALKGLTVPVRVSGPFEKPAFKLELANLVSDAAKARVEEKQQEVKQKIENKVQDKLKGLFGK